MQKPLTFLAPFVVAASLALPAVAQDDTAENTEAQTDVTAETVVATVNGTDITIGSMIIARATLPEQYQQLPPKSCSKAFWISLCSKPPCRKILTVKCQSGSRWRLKTNVAS